MPFNSYAFVAFVLALCAIYNGIPSRVRPGLLLLASYLFYAQFGVGHLGLLVFVSACAYVAGRIVSADPRASTCVACIVILLLPLGVTKYFDFFQETLRRSRIAAATPLNLLLPVGISFYTFQAISYVIDVRRGMVAPERSLLQFALYLSWFSQILAGPIERARSLMPQLRSVRPTAARDVYIGLKYLLWGFFCKLVVADNVAFIVDRIVASPRTESGATLAITFVLYSFQIYFDFLGYTSIAIGAARLFSVRLSRNFNKPYSSSSLQQFWRRWHMTLSAWFRDYVYVPLGGRTTRGANRLGHILAVFVLSGLWHGAAFNFLAWGSFHGLAYSIEEWLRRRVSGRFAMSRAARRSLRPVKVFVTFAVVTLGWVFFRLSSAQEIQTVFARLAGADQGVPYFALNPVLLQVDSIVFIVVAGIALLLDSLAKVRAINEQVPKTPLQIGRELLVVNSLAVMLVLLGDRPSRDFIYFRF